MKLTNENISIGTKIRLRLGKMQLIPYTSNKNIPDLVWGNGEVVKESHNKCACIVDVDFSEYGVSKRTFTCFATETGIFPNIEIA